jgi:hypothetical protein
MRRQEFDLARRAVDVIFAAVGPIAIFKIWRRFNNWILDSYRPELHYMRGPGPKWREKHAHVGSDQWPEWADGPFLTSRDQGTASHLDHCSGDDRHQPPDDRFRKMSPGRRQIVFDNYCVPSRRCGQAHSSAAVLGRGRHERPASENLRVSKRNR